MSVQTKEVPTALAALLKAKGQNVNKDTATVQHPVATIVENPQNLEVAATSAEDPELNTPVTLEPQNPDPTDKRDYKESYKELKQHYDTTVHQLRTQVQQLETQVATATTARVKPPKSKEEVAEFAKQYPEAVDIFRTIVLDELANDGQGIKAKIENVDKLQKQLVEKEAFTELLKEHPDALKIRESAQFEKWYKEQPESIQMILSNSTDIKAVSKQLTLYKLETGIPTGKEKTKAAAQTRIDASLGVDVKGRTEIAAQKKIWTGSEIQKICSNHSLWRKHATEIDEARREGRVDMSK